MVSSGKEYWELFRLQEHIEVFRASLAQLDEDLHRIQ